jgi:hypothetical protein
VLWFVVVTTIGLLLAGGGILIVVERALTGQAERHAVERARIAANALLDRQLRAGDLSGALSPERRRHLSALFSRASGPNRAVRRSTAAMARSSRHVEPGYAQPLRLPCSAP